MGQGEVRRRQIADFSDIIVLIGLLFLKRVTEENGLAFLIAAYILYYFIWVIVGKGESAVIARILRGRGQRGQYKNLFVAKTRMVFIQLLSGVLGAILLALLGSLVMFHLFEMENGVAVLVVMSVSMVFRSLNESYCGIMRAEGKEYPVAAAGVLRSLLFLFLAFLVGGRFRARGIKVAAFLVQKNFIGMYAAMGVAVALSITEILMFAFLFVIDKFIQGKNISGTRMLESTAEMAVMMYGGRGEHILSGLLMCLPFISGISIYAKAVEEGVSVADTLGLFSGTFLILIFIIYKFHNIMSLPLVARVNSFNRKENVRLERAAFEYGIHGMVVWGLYFCMILMTLCEEWAGLTGASDAAKTAELLSVGAVVIIFAGLADYFGMLLYYLDNRIVLLAGLGIMNVVFIVMLAILTRQGNLGIDALVYSAILPAGILCFLSGLFVMRNTGIGVDWLQTVGLPVVAALVTGLISWFSQRFIVPHLGNLVTILLCSFFSFVVYIALLLIVRNVREPELKYFPGGRILGFFEKLFHI